MNGLGALTDSAGHLAGRPLEEWNAAYEKVENYFHALRGPQQSPARPAGAPGARTRRAPRACRTERSATQLAAEEMESHCD